MMPKCAALIHHCGIETCAASLLSGVPQIASPVMVDQPHYAKMLQRLGEANDYQDITATTHEDFR